MIENKCRVFLNVPALGLPNILKALEAFTSARHLPWSLLSVSRCQANHECSFLPQQEIWLIQPVLPLSGVQREGEFPHQASNDDAHLSTCQSTMTNQSHCHILVWSTDFDLLSSNASTHSKGKWHEDILSILVVLRVTQPSFGAEVVGIFEVGRVAVCRPHPHSLGSEKLVSHRNISLEGNLET